MKRQVADLEEKAGRRHDSVWRRSASLHSTKLCPLHRPEYSDQAPTLLSAPCPGRTLPRLTSTLQRRSLKPQVPLLEEQHKAFRTPSHSALSDLQ